MYVIKNSVPVKEWYNPWPTDHKTFSYQGYSPTLANPNMKKYSSFHHRSRADQYKKIFARM